VLALLTSGLTASIALEQSAGLRLPLDLPPGLPRPPPDSRAAPRTVLVTAAAGGTGQFAVQLAKLAGCRVVATCGGDDKAALLTRLGADRVINYRCGPGGRRTDAFGRFAAVWGGSVGGSASVGLGGQQALFRFWQAVSCPHFKTERAQDPNANPPHTHQPPNPSSNPNPLPPQPHNPTTLKTPTPPRHEDVRAALKAECPKGVDVVYESVGGKVRGGLGGLGGWLFGGKVGGSWRSQGRPLLAGRGAFSRDDDYRAETPVL
jgi:hypothetical protein